MIEIPKGYSTQYPRMIRFSEFSKNFGLRWGENYDENVAFYEISDYRSRTLRLWI